MKNIIFDKQKAAIVSVLDITRDCHGTLRARFLIANGTGAQHHRSFAAHSLQAMALKADRLTKARTTHALRKEALYPDIARLPPALSDTDKIGAFNQIRSEIKPELRLALEGIEHVQCVAAIVRSAIDAVKSFPS